MSDSRIEKSGVNAAVAVTQNLLNIGLTFLSRIIFVRILDEGYLGINGLFTNILDLLSLADLGIATAMMYSLYDPIARKDTEKIKNLICFFRKIYLGIAGAVFIIGIGIIPFLSHIIHLNHPIEHITLYYLIALMNVVISYLYVYRTTLMVADQKSYILNNCMIIFRFITFCVQIAVLVLTKNYLLYLLAALVINFLCNWEQNRITLAHYPYLKTHNKTQLPTEDKKTIFENVKALFIYKVAAVINNDIDSILISIMVGTIYVGYYSNYIAVIGAVTTLITAVFTAVKASVGNLVADKKCQITDELQTYKILEFMNYWVVSFSTIAMACLSNDFIELCFGQKYVLSMIIVFALAANFYTGNIRQSIWVFRETTGFFKEVKYITFVHATLNLLLSIIMGKYLGMFGILAATVVSRLLFASWNEPYMFFRKHFGVSPKSYFYNDLKWGVITLSVGGIIWWICSLIHLQIQWFTIGGKLFVCIIVPNAIFLLIHLKSEQFGQMKELLIKPLLEKIKLR